MRHPVRLLLLLAVAWVPALVLAPPAAVWGQAQEIEPRETETRSASDALPHAGAFERPPFPAPNRFRTASGAPGPDYWQQRADYLIRARLEPESRRISGTQTITYTNNSPDTLRHLWLQLDQNLFDPESRGARITPPGARSGGAFRGGGFDLSGVRVDGSRDEPEVLVDGTVMRVILPEPLPPGGGRLELSMDFAFTVPERGADRTGWMRVGQGTIYQVAQWYPRMFVYDDLHAWNVLPYLGQGEWYLEFGDFEVEITVPREFIVAATGELQNPEDVLTGEQRNRLERARQSDEPIHVIPPAEVGRAAARPAGEGPLTWRFRAENVRDFGWAASQAFIWDAAGWEGILLMSFYPREGLGGEGPPGWEESTRYVRHAIQHYSEKWHPYPYPVAINVAGPVLGMEYPMIAFCSVRARGQGLFMVTDHEFAHMWFPMLVGSDERRHFWMDEGLASFMGHYSEQAFRGEDARPLPVLAGEIGRGMRSAPGAQATVTRTDRLRPETLGFAAYRKPGYALVLLREHVLGPDRFDPAFREYIRRWAYRHPQPADFFRTIEDVTGEDLSWFWQGWFYGTGTLDKAVAGVETRRDTAYVTIETRGELVMPADVRLVWRDGSEVTRRIPVEAWYLGNSFVLRVPTDGRELRAVQVDPEGLLPDTNRRNNVWGRGVVGR